MIGLCSNYSRERFVISQDLLGHQKYSEILSSWINVLLLSVSSMWLEVSKLQIGHLEATGKILFYLFVHRLLDAWL